MQVPLSWLVELVPGLAAVPPAALAARLTRAGLAVERVETVGGGVRGVVVGEVVEAVPEPQRNGKVVHWCQVRVADGAPPRGIVCGAANIAAGQRVPVALPGAELPGGVTITARTTYGHVSDGMVCSSTELGSPEPVDAVEGILVLPPDSPLGADVADLLGLGASTVLDVAVTADRGYALSLRGVAREAATASGLPFTDPAEAPGRRAPAAGGGHPVRVEDPVGCVRYVARTISGLDPTATTPAQLQERLRLAGMRPISAAVDVTNLVMLGLGQPLHAFDADRLRGGLVVRRAQPGERLRTLDGVVRDLHPEDLVIADDTGPVALAGVMGGEPTEVTASTRRVLLEAACFDPTAVRRATVRHGLASEASRRFERGVDPELAPAAAQAALELLVGLTGGEAESGCADVDGRGPRAVLTLAVSAPAAKVGRDYDREVIVGRLRDVGCTVADTGADTLAVLPPPWRPDLTGPAELIEEVARLEGYETIPSVLPRAVPGRGLPAAATARRAVGRALAAAGCTEVVVPPFMGVADLTALGLRPGTSDDVRAFSVALAESSAEDANLLRTTLLPGLLRTLARNLARGARDLALYEVGSVFLPGAGGRPPAPHLPTDRRPTDEQLAALQAALPAQPTTVAITITGLRTLGGWDSTPRAATWADAVAAARTVARAVRVPLEVRQGERTPWHPGRCALLATGGRDVGAAGELHPQVLDTLGLPARTCAVELDLDALLAAGSSPPRVLPLSPYPPVWRDVALVLAADVPSAAVEAALRSGAGQLLEALRLFDLYAGEQLTAGERSLAYRLTLRAPDRTLTDAEANAARDAAVSAAAARTGARLRT